MGSARVLVGSMLASSFLAADVLLALQVSADPARPQADRLVAALFTSVAVRAGEADLHFYIASFNPSPLYRHARRLVVVVFWVYYAALIFILGGEVGQVYELRRTRKRQRETFEGLRLARRLLRRADHTQLEGSSREKWRS